MNYSQKQVAKNELWKSGFNIKTNITVETNKR